MFLLSSGCNICSVWLPHGAVGWSVVCNCGISWSYYLFSEVIFVHLVWIGGVKHRLINRVVVPGVNHRINISLQLSSRTQKPAEKQCEKI